MTSKELFYKMNNGEIPTEIPFVPTIYEHAPKLIGYTPSKVCQNADLIVQAQLKAFELYGHDLVSVGVDIYNVEHEALGAQYSYFDDERLPSSKDILINSLEDLKNLFIPDPQKDGRMPVFLDAAQRVHNEIGDVVNVSGTIVGPFTLAAINRGFENLLYDFIDDMEFAITQLEFALQVVLSYGKAFIRRGVGVAINDSWIAPPLLSPQLYAEIIKPYETRLIAALKEEGASGVSLICGGYTTPIAQDMALTGTSLLMADAGNDRLLFKTICQKHGIILRAGVAPKLVAYGSEEELMEETKQVLADCADYEKFIIGCGVVPYDTPTQRIIAFKEMVKALNPRK